MHRAADGSFLENKVATWHKFCIIIEGMRLGAYFDLIQMTIQNVHIF
jgi:hypothetical protein